MPAEGRHVRCLRCGLVWHVVPTHADKLLAAAAALCPELILVDRALAAQAQASQPEPPADAAADMPWSNECAGDSLDDGPPMEGGSATVAADREQAAEDGFVLAAADELAADDGPALVVADDELAAADGFVLAAADDELAVDDGSVSPADDDEHAADDELVLVAADDEQAAEDKWFAAEADEYDPAAADEAPADEPDESAEVQAPPIVQVDFDEDRLPIEVDEDAAEYSQEPLEAIRSLAGWRHLDHARHWSPPRWPMSRLHTGILALFIADCILVGWRGDVVRALPQTDAFYKLVGLPVNLSGLAFDGITTTTEQHKGDPVLVVEGNIVNSARKFVDVPRLKFVVRDAARQEIYSWTAVASRTLLPPGEAVSFRTRLTSPPPNAHDVLLRFVDRRDIVAAAR